MENIGALQESLTVVNSRPIQQTLKAKLNWRLRYDGSRPGVQSASLYDNFRKRENYVIMMSLMTS